MTLLVAGLALFIGAHLVPTLVPLRAALVAPIGEQRYKGVFSLVSLAGFALIIAGYALAPRGPQLFAPFRFAIAVAPFAVTIALVLFAAANMRTHIRGALRHPMLLGLLVWSLVHLLANGDLRGTVLFGAFLAYALVDLASAVSRHAVKPIVADVKFDAVAIATGVAIAVLVMTFHRPLFGVSVVPFGV